METIRPSNRFQQGGLCDSALDHMPDACSNEDREQQLIQRQQLQQEGRNWLCGIVDRERNLLLACVVLVVALNVTEGRYILYPFMIFSTWIHEMCHGIAAILTGGYFTKMIVFPDGSGLAYTATSSDWERGFVASAGYPGTAVMGCLLLLFRRTTLGPTLGTIAIGICMVLSCILWVRDTFGLIALLLEGTILIVLGWKLPARLLDHLYNFLAAACCLNAVESIHDLFAVGSYTVGGETVESSDAHTVADKWGMNYQFWACLWLVMSAACTVIGIVFAANAKEIPCLKGRSFSS